MAGNLWIPAWIGVGSNLDDPAARVRAGLAALAALPDTRLLLASSLYANPPLGEAPQPDYVNAVAGLLTQLPARALLDALQAVERAAGRDRAREPRWGPRRLDLDILSYGLQRIDEPGLQVPHPGIPQRNFVLFPLLEVAPGLWLPGLGSLPRLAAGSDPSALRRLDEPAATQ